VDVYLVPVGRGRHALYCEPSDDGRPVVTAESGFWKRWVDKFSEVIDAVEREQDEQAAGARPDPERTGMWGRMRTRVMAWIAEKIAEQRLLWRLRGQVQVRALAPEEIDNERARAIIRGSLAADFDRHRWWLVVDSLGGVVAAALMFIPGPNLIGYYFVFRIVGHFLSLRGARQGLTKVRWDVHPSAPLSALVGIEDMPPREREQRVRAVADQLCLRRLPRFYRRTALRTA
jgi:hypothetical protein